MHKTCAENCVDEGTLTGWSEMEGVLVEGWANIADRNLREEREKEEAEVAVKANRKELENDG